MDSPRKPSQSLSNPTGWIAIQRGQAHPQTLESTLSQDQPVRWAAENDCEEPWNRLAMVQAISNLDCGSHRQPEPRREPVIERVKLIESADKMIPPPITSGNFPEEDPTKLCLDKSCRDELYLDKLCRDNPCPSMMPLNKLDLDEPTTPNAQTETPERESSNTTVSQKAHYDYRRLGC